MRARQWAICGDSASVRWMVEPRSCTMRLTSSLLAGSVLSIGLPDKIMRTCSRACQARREGGINGLGGYGLAAGEGGDHARQLGGLHRLREVHLEAGGEDTRAVLALGVGGQRGGRGLASA